MFRDKFNKIYTRLLKILPREIKEDLNKWRDILCSLVGRLNILKMLFPSQFIYRFNTIPGQIPAFWGEN